MNGSRYDVSITIPIKSIPGADIYRIYEDATLIIDERRRRLIISPSEIGDVRYKGQRLIADSSKFGSKTVLGKDDYAIQSSSLWKATKGIAKTVVIAAGLGAMALIGYAHARPEDPEKRNKAMEIIYEKAMVPVREIQGCMEAGLTSATENIEKFLNESDNE